MPRSIPPPHPGETILEDVLKPLGMSANQLAKALGVTAARLNDIVRGRRGITADTALRLARGGLNFSGCLPYDYLKRLSCWKLDPSRRVTALW
jgi:addiction module HigA family antidote